MTPPDWCTSTKDRYAWVHQAAHLLANPDHLDVLILRRAYRHLLAEMTPQRDVAGFLGVISG